MLKFRFLTYSNFGSMEKWYDEMAKEGYQIEKIVIPFSNEEDLERILKILNIEVKADE